MIYKLKLSEENSYLDSSYKDWFDANGWSYKDLFVFCCDATEDLFYLRHINEKLEKLVDKVMFEPVPPPTKELEEWV